MTVPWQMLGEVCVPRKEEMKDDARAELQHTFPDAWPVFSHKDDWILILVGRLENVPSHLRELQHAFLQQRLLSISIKLLWCCSRLKAGCDDKFPLSRLSLSFVKNQVPYSPKPWRILCFFAKPSSYFKAKVQQITYQQSIWGDSPFFPFTYTCGTNPWTVLKQFLNRQAVFLGCSKFLCHGKTWHISGPPEHLTPTVDDGWIPEMIRCTTIFFVVQSLHWAMTSSVVPGPKIELNLEVGSIFMNHPCETFFWVWYCSITCCILMLSFEDGWKSHRSWVNWDALCWQKLVQAMVTERLLDRLHCTSQVKKKLTWFALVQDKAIDRHQVL